VIISRPRRPFPPTQHQFAFAGSVDHRHGLCHELIGPAGRALLVALRLEHDAFPGSLRGVSELLQRMKRGVEHGARQIHARPFARLPLLEQPFVRGQRRPGLADPVLGCAELARRAQAPYFTAQQPLMKLGRQIEREGRILQPAAWLLLCVRLEPLLGPAGL